MAAPGIKCFTKESVAPQLTTELQVGGEELIHGIADRWRSLCEETGSAPFQRPEWVQTYLRAFEPDNKLVLLTVYSAEELVAVLPVVRKRCTYACVPVVKLAGAANVHSVRFEIVRKKGIVGEAALGSIWQFCALCRDGTFLSFQYFRNTEAASNSWRLPAGTVLTLSAFWHRIARYCTCNAMGMAG